MHYWFAESEMKIPKMPHWYYGLMYYRPGASSLDGMLIDELRPLIVSDLSITGETCLKIGIPQLMYNEFGWQKEANIRYMPPPLIFL